MDEHSSRVLHRLNEALCIFYDGVADLRRLQLAASTASEALDGGASIELRRLLEGFSDKLIEIEEVYSKERERKLALEIIARYRERLAALGVSIAQRDEAE
jgi:hypothetical protein